MTKTSRYKGLVLGSFLAPEIGMIFGELGPPLYGLALTTALRKTGTKLTRVFLFSVTCSMHWNYIRIYLFLEETGWIGSFQLMTCNLIVCILSDKSTHVYIYIIYHMYASSFEIRLPSVSFQKFGPRSKMFLQKKFLVFSKNKCWHEKTADTNEEFQWLTSIGAHLFSLEQRGKCDPVQPSNGWGVGSRI